MRNGFRIVVTLLSVTLGRHLHDKYRVQDTCFTSRRSENGWKRLAAYSPPEVDRILHWVYYNQTPMHSIFYLLNGDYMTGHSLQAEISLYRGSQKVGTFPAPNKPAYKRRETSWTHPASMFRLFWSFQHHPKKTASLQSPDIPEVPPRLHQGIF